MRAIAVILLMAGLAACGSKDGTDGGTEDPVARGEYLVQRVGMCIDCHSPMTPKGPDPDKAMQGAMLPFAPLQEVPGWAKHAPKLAGLDTHTREEVISVLTKGVDLEGEHPSPPMPHYRLTQEDAEAVAG